MSCSPLPSVMVGSTRTPAARSVAVADAALDAEMFEAIVIEGASPRAEYQNGETSPKRSAFCTTAATPSEVSQYGIQPVTIGRGAGDAACAGVEPTASTPSPRAPAVRPTTIRLVARCMALPRVDEGEGDP